MNTLLIIIIIAVVVVILVIYLIAYIKNKIKNKIIDTGAELVTKTAENVLDEKSANRVKEATNLTANVIKDGQSALISAAAKKGLEIVKDKKKTN